MPTSGRARPSSTTSEADQLGSFPVPTGGFADVLSFPLNFAGVAAYNAERGGFFSIGGRTVEDAEGFVDWYLFGGAQPPVGGTQQLVATCSFPTTTSECKNGGWRTYGVFRNQGDCVSFVATGGKTPGLEESVAIRPRHLDLAPAAV